MNKVITALLVAITTGATFQTKAINYTVLCENLHDDGANASQVAAKRTTHPYSRAEAITVCADYAKGRAGNWVFREANEGSPQRMVGQGFEWALAYMK